MAHQKAISTGHPFSARQQQTRQLLPRTLLCATKPCPGAATCAASCRHHPSPALPLPCPAHARPSASAGHVGSSGARVRRRLVRRSSCRFSECPSQPHSAWMPACPAAGPLRECDGVRQGPPDAPGLPRGPPRPQTSQSPAIEIETTCCGGTDIALVHRHHVTASQHTQHDCMPHLAGILRRRRRCLPVHLQGHVTASLAG